jgi:hypothetical protein
MGLSHLRCCAGTRQAVQGQSLRRLPQNSQKRIGSPREVPTLFNSWRNQGDYTHNPGLLVKLRVESRRRSGFSLPVAVECTFAPSPQSGLAWLCFLFPLVEPDRQIARIRLSEKTHAQLKERVTPSATSEHKPGAARLVVNPARKSVVISASCTISGSTLPWPCDRRKVVKNSIIILAVEEFCIRQFSQIRKPHAMLT